MEYLAIAEVVRDFQVFRYFKIDSIHKVGKPINVFCQEILQHWIREDGKREVIARRHLQSYWGWSNSWYGDLEIRDKKDLRKFDVYHTLIHPDSEFMPKYTKHGIGHKIKCMTLLEAIQEIPNNPRMETLLKAGQYDLVNTKFRGDISYNWNSIKIYLRRKKKITDPSLFFDYLQLLRFFNRDLRNDKYLFPKNLKREHDRLFKKKLEVEHKQEIERKKARAEQNEKLFKELKQAFFGLQFKGFGIVVKALESVQEFIDEGEALKHCVFANEYFKKPDSLILSARTETEILETIEVDLRTLKIVQSRGKFNKPSVKNKQIIKLVNQNMDLIKQRIST